MTVNGERERVHPTSVAEEPSPRKETGGKPPSSPCPLKGDGPGAREIRPNLVGQPLGVADPMLAAQLGRPWEPAHLSP